ncbi:hypothetical protein [Kitasatospora sp. NPDC015120]
MLSPAERQAAEQRQMDEYLRRAREATARAEAARQAARQSTPAPAPLTT